MYINYFRFKEEPFSNTPDPRFLFLSRQHEEALESLIYGINQRKGFMAIIGDIGTGKTTLCRTLLQRLGEDIDTSVIFNPMLSVNELLMAINDDFGNKNVADKSIKGQIDALNKFMLHRLKFNKNAVVIIDEAQHLTPEALEMLRMLSNLETEDKKLMQIIFLGQKELEETLCSPKLKQLNQRIAIKYYLGPLSFLETCDYILHRLSVASFERRVQFEEKALKRVHKYSQGVPRIINTLCDRALLNAYSERQRLITKKAIKMVKADIDGSFNMPGLKAVKSSQTSLMKWLFG